MQWRKTDLEKYATSKEYVDTLLIPLIPFQFTNEEAYAKDALQREFLMLFAHEVEQELMGRVMLTPVYNYIPSDGNDEINRLERWAEESMKQPFEHIFYLTFDSSWKKEEKNLSGTLLWFPGVYSADISSGEMQSMVKEHVKQIVELIRSYWN